MCLFYSNKGYKGIFFGFDCVDRDSQNINGDFDIVVVSMSKLESTLQCTVCPDTCRSRPCHGQSNAPQH